MWLASLYQFFKSELDSRVLFVYQLPRLYLQTQAVVLNHVAELQAVQQQFERVVQVRLVALEVHVCRQSERTVDVLIADGALVVERILVVLHRLRLRQRTMARNRYYLVAISLAWYVTTYRYLVHANDISIINHENFT